jgi:hypothetical protein
MGVLDAALVEVADLARSGAALARKALAASRGPLTAVSTTASAAQ